MKLTIRHILLCAAVSSAFIMPACKDRSSEYAKWHMPGAPLKIRWQDEGEFEKRSAFSNDSGIFRLILGYKRHDESGWQGLDLPQARTLRIILMGELLKIPEFKRLISEDVQKTLFVESFIVFCIIDRDWLHDAMFREMSELYGTESAELARKMALDYYYGRKQMPEEEKYEVRKKTRELWTIDDSEYENAHVAGVDYLTKTLKRGKTAPQDWEADYNMKRGAALCYLSNHYDFSEWKASRAVEESYFRHMEKESVSQYCQALWAASSACPNRDLKGGEGEKTLKALCIHALHRA